MHMYALISISTHLSERQEHNPTRDPRATDEDYSGKYWERLLTGPDAWTEAQLSRLKQAMRESLIVAAETSGVFSELVGPGRITEDWKQKLSAYRHLARESGYEMGPFRFNEATHMVIAEIHKIPR